MSTSKYNHSLRRFEEEEQTKFQPDDIECSLSCENENDKSENGSYDGKNTNGPIQATPQTTGGTAKNPQVHESEHTSGAFLKNNFSNAKKRSKRRLCFEENFTAPYPEPDTVQNADELGLDKETPFFLKNSLGSKGKAVAAVMESPVMYKKKNRAQRVPVETVGRQIGFDSGNNSPRGLESS